MKKKLSKRYANLPLERRRLLEKRDEYLEKSRPLSDSHLYAIVKVPGEMEALDLRSAIMHFSILQDALDFHARLPRHKFTIVRFDWGVETEEGVNHPTDDSKNWGITADDNYHLGPDGATQESDLVVGQVW